MPSNYPNNITDVDKPLALYNMRFDKPVTINITYNVGFFTWLFRAVLRRKPLHYIIMTDCNFLDSGRVQEKSNGLLKKMIKVVIKKKQAEPRRRTR